jgi:hypothetical protein
MKHNRSDIVNMTIFKCKQALFSLIIPNLYLAIISS